MNILSSGDPFREAALGALDLVSVCLDAAAVEGRSFMYCRGPRMRPSCNNPRHTPVSSDAPLKHVLEIMGTPLKHACATFHHVTMLEHICLLEEQKTNAKSTLEVTLSYLHENSAGRRETVLPLQGEVSFGCCLVQRSPAYIIFRIHHDVG